MPHITVEYSTDIADHINFPALLRDLHQALADEGIDISRIKTRGIPLPYVVVGDNSGRRNMVHLTLLLLAGRDTATKKQYADPLYALLKERIHAAMPKCAITLEVRDMDPDTYYL